MRTQAMYFSKVLGAAAIGALLSVGIGYSSMSHAAQGCGFGYHMTAFGRCVPNEPGPRATIIPGRPDCWRNYLGEVRCYR
ncbi:GCG_CRPN prefix-to-repeats domain-containing protein [Legionella dresdenensis]|uniref:GCG_CRPN prefix-to-repeats domain-containing protein n=1 Tax=Legionella dresdenensis TaxID=450200 RepID=A0ABV8CH59_9GAMM